MFLETHSSIWIDAPAATVFDALADATTPPVVFGGEVEGGMVGGGPVRRGGILRVHRADGSVIDEVLTDVSRPSRLAYRLVNRLPHPYSLLMRDVVAEWRLRPFAEGTTVIWRFEFELRRSWVAPLALFVIKHWFHRAVDQGLEHLQQRCATASAPLAAMAS